MLLPISSVGERGAKQRRKMMKIQKRLLALLLIFAFIFTVTPVVLAQNADKVNINTASAEEISKLKNIGAKYAERIVQYREQNGPFKSPDDIMKVKGIGAKTFELNKDKITVE